MNAGRLHTVQHVEEGKPLLLPCMLNDPTMKVSFSKRVGLVSIAKVQLFETV